MDTADGRNAGVLFIVFLAEQWRMKVVVFVCWFLSKVSEDAKNYWIFLQKEYMRQFWACTKTGSDRHCSKGGL